MTRPAREILNVARKLAERDRLQIVEELLASLEPVNEENVDVAWAKEVERRSRQIKEGVVRPISWEEVVPGEKADSWPRLRLYFIPVHHKTTYRHFSIPL